ncbi:uDENN domain [Trinorchestia longiramus]|nr:uDENN domain [Trinorchestia longiramus]
MLDGVKPPNQVAIVAKIRNKKHVGAGRWNRPTKCKFCPVTLPLLLAFSQLPALGASSGGFQPQLQNPFGLSNFRHDNGGGQVNIDGFPQTPGQPLGGLYQQPVQVGIATVTCQPETRLTVVTSTLLLPTTVAVTRTRALPTTIFTQLVQTTYVPTTFYETQIQTSVIPPVIQTTTEVITATRYVTRAQFFTETSFVTDVRVERFTETRTNSITITQTSNNFQVVTTIRTTTIVQNNIQTQILTQTQTQRYTETLPQVQYFTNTVTTHSKVYNFTSRSTPNTLLECWCEVVAGQGPDQPPWIIHKFPSTFDDQQKLNSIPQFVFPCKIETSVVLNFSFVLTALDSTFTFGFCRHSPNAESALVVLSHLPWDSTFYKILNLCSELQSSDSPGDVWSFLQTLYTAPVPDPGSDLTLTYPPANKMFVTRCPNHLTLPSLPDNRNLLEYINAVSPETMMVVFASLLFERRIMISSKHLHRVSACVQAANALLYPMSWQHIYIPILPEPLIDYLLAPMPFLIGVPDVLMQKVPLDEIRDVVYLNADTNEITTPFSDLAELPNEVHSELRRRLSEPNQGMGDSVPRAFLKALVMLIGNYRDALEFNEEDRKVFFNTQKFVAGRPPRLQVFVGKMLELQIFRQFIEEREDQENKGVATSDEFEREVSVYSDRPSKHQQRLHAVMKGGGAIVKNIKIKASAGKRKNPKGQGTKEAPTGGDGGNGSAKGRKGASEVFKAQRSKSSGDADCGASGGENGSGDTQSLKNEMNQSGAVAAATAAQEGGRMTCWFDEDASLDLETNPAVKSAVKSVSKSSKQVRERGAEKYKEFRGKMKLPSTRSPEHVPWAPHDPDDRSPPPSPPSRLPTNRPNMEVIAKVSYKRPLPNHVNRSEGVPASASASSFRSPDSPGHTPAPHTIDLMGELEQELFSRLSEPNSFSGRSSLTTPFTSANQQPTAGRPAVNGNRRRSLSRPTTLPPPVPTSIPPPTPASRAHTTLGGASIGRDSESPTTQGLSGTKSVCRDPLLLRHLPVAPLWLDLSPVFHGVVLSSASSSSLTSLPSIDVSLDIELPPPITCQILPSASHTLPHKHRQAQDHETGDADDWEKSHRHYFRSPKPFSGGELHYSTLPKSLHSSEANTPRTPRNGVYSFTTPEVCEPSRYTRNTASPSCLTNSRRSQFQESSPATGITSRLYTTSTKAVGAENHVLVHRKLDVVSLYGTADDFKTRMLYPKNSLDGSDTSKRSNQQKTSSKYDKPKSDDITLPLSQNRSQKLASSRTTSVPKSPSRYTVDAISVSNARTSSTNAAATGSTSVKKTTWADQRSMMVSSDICTPERENEVSVSKAASEAGAVQVRASTLKASHYLDRSVSFSSSCCVSRPRGLRNTTSMSMGPTRPHAVTRGYSTLGRLKDVPKYDASRAFSDSLAAFTSRGNNSEYFYSALSRSRGGSLAHIDNDNLEPSDTCPELSRDLSLKRQETGTSFQLGPYYGRYHHQHSKDGVRQHDRDIMTMSLPPGLANIGSLPSNYGAHTLGPFYSSHSACYPSSLKSTQKTAAACHDVYYSNLPYSWNSAVTEKSNSTDSAPPVLPNRTSSLLSSKAAAAAAYSSESRISNASAVEAPCAPPRTTSLEPLSRGVRRATEETLCGGAPHCGSPFVAGPLNPFVVWPLPDRDLILLGSPQEEEFDPLLSKSLAPPPPSNGPPEDLNLPLPPPRPNAPHPVPSFLHSLAPSTRIQHTAVPASARPENGVQSAKGDGKGSFSSSSSSSLSSIYQPYIPFTSSLHDIKSLPSGDLPTPNSSSLPDFSASCYSSTLATSSIAATTASTTTTTSTTGSVGQPLGIIPLPRPRPAPPVLPTPARRPPNSGSASGHHKRLNSIPTSTMASLPAALQNHLANQLNKTPPGKFYKEPPSSSTRFQSTTTVRPTAQTNPLYNTHELVLGDKIEPHVNSYPQPTLSSYTSVRTSSYSSTQSHQSPATSTHASSIISSATHGVNPTLANSNSLAKPNSAAAFASTMINKSPGVRPVTPNINNNNNINNVDEPKMLGSFSKSFAQMKLNQSGDSKVSSTAENQPPSVAERKPGWTSFE